MALPLGKLTILIGAGLVGSVLAKEGSLPDVSHFVSGAFKIVLRQLKQDEPAKSGSRPRNDTLTAQVNSLRHELQLLASNRPITIISTGGSGGKKYGWIIIIGVIGYGYVWWKGWKLPDFMFATRRSLSDACNNVGSQIDGFYESLSGTKRELGSEIDRMDRTLDASTIIIKETGREVNELRDGTANMKDDVRVRVSLVSGHQSYMALPLGKLTILIGAGLVGSVLAKEGSLPDVSHFVSGAFKIVLRQLKQEEPAKSGSRPRNDTLTAQVNSLRHELQLLASNRPITIISTGGSGGKKYGWIIIIGVIGYGYVWWKGWKLPDFMFATRRSLSDACNNVGSQIDGFYESLSGTKRELGSEIDRMDRTLDASTIIIKETGREVNELRDGTANMKDDVRSVFEAVETLVRNFFSNLHIC
ncbi:hypothetical protein F2Q68_00005653 [Brassica cretica]|uniref:DUF1664 domain-containing protein n=1 Tax=Brassica cretica TaxID=69181 RepID=A0A8S9JG39_BRACR|nr:hypothetical protein F2Q68_00005653 [Brassica cretica]